MFDVIDYPSPNVDVRTQPITYVIIHATEEDLETSLSILTDEKRKVSAHYVIAENGDIYQLVDPKVRAFHAGISAWGDVVGLNDVSIGIEMVHPSPDAGVFPYPNAQIKALITLLDQLVPEYHIPASHILAHSDIAPNRKRDPGNEFPWEELAQHGYGLWPKASNEDVILDEAGAQKLLADIGYRMGSFLEQVTAFQRHFVRHHVSGVLDANTCRKLKEVASL